MATCNSDSVTVRGFPFLDDDKTITYIKHSKVMFIMRGLSGSGKSTIVQALQEKYPEHCVCSADDHFVQEDGSYKWEKTELEAAHKECQSKAEAACKADTPVVIIDNTNVRRWEMKFYVNAAATYRYTVVVVTPKTSWYLDAAILAKKNKHGFEEVKLRLKVELFKKENAIPYYFGWFLNDKAADKVLSLADKYFSLCASKCTEFADFFKENVMGPEKELTFSSLYQRDRLASGGVRSLHCTAYFCGRHSHPESEAYANDPAVVKAVGKCFPMTVIGIIITPRTVGARIKLNDKEKKLFRNDDDVVKKKTAPLASRFNVLSLDDDEDDDDFERFQPTSGSGSRAHFTLGLAPGVSAVDTGVEQVNIIKIEGERLDDDDCIEVEGAAIRYYEEGRCVVYFDEPCIVPSLFSGEY